MRRSILFFALLVAACDGDWDDWSSGNGNEIVFGIQQDKSGVAADYDFVGLDGHGGSVAWAFRDGDGRGQCWFENLDDRLGKPHVENGTARWSGGTLGTPPGSGLTILANQPDATKQATAGWASSDILSFYAEGFAMPPLDGVQMRAPLVELTVGAITPAPDANGAITIKPSSDVSVAWTPPAGETASRILVTLETEHANVRCFDYPDTGSIVVPARWIAQLFPVGTAGTAADGGAPSVNDASVDASADGGASAPSGPAVISGHLTIASHRQSTTFAPGDWTVYAVATSVHRDIAFTGTRD